MRHGFSFPPTSAAELGARLGLRRQARSWRGACPACSYPGAFSVRQGKNDWPLTFCANGCDRQAVNDAVARASGSPLPARASVPRTRSDREAVALRYWSGCVSAAGSLAARYLATRALPDLPTSPALRFRDDMPHPEGGRLPAMVALVRDVAGAPLAIHRTYLAADGSGKATIVPAKASLGPVQGGAIRLAELEPGVPVVLGEGIETSASAGMLLGLPAWAALSAGNLSRSLQLPPDVRHVIIAVDPDPAGEKAAAEAADRWMAQGRRVQFARPPEGVGDFNDYLRARARGDDHAGR